MKVPSQCDDASEASCGSSVSSDETSNEEIELTSTRIWQKLGVSNDVHWVEAHANLLMVVCFASYFRNKAVSHRECATIYITRVLFAKNKPDSICQTVKVPLFGHSTYVNQSKMLRKQQSWRHFSRWFREVGFQSRGTAQVSWPGVHLHKKTLLTGHVTTNCCWYANQSQFQAGKKRDLSAIWFKEENQLNIVADLGCIGTNRHKWCVMDLNP